MQVHQHARPHIESHNRSKNHSSVAGAAYRLGLKLYDERAGIWHDYRKRELGEEIVRALTIAPAGSPSWATDPGQLWNRVEASEKRKDAQVARDYRIPIPFGLSDQDAGDLSEEMARFISDELQTPVSLGLHRDADRDALGNLKPSDKQGFHAHLYFPTRRLADDIGGDGDGGGTGFGAKLTVLSNKNSSTVFVEMLNAKWSELANDFSREVGSDLRFEYKSYKRLGLNLTPQPTLGQSASAMERRGIYTNRGDSLREALAVAQVYQKAHAGALDAQHAQALQDVSREAGKSAQTQTGALPKSVVSLFGPKRAKATVSTLIPRQGSLAYRLRASAPAPTTKEEYEELERSLVLIEALDKAFATYYELQQQMDDILKVIQANRASSLEAQFQADQSREKRKFAQVKLMRWEDDNRWRIKMFARMGGLPMEDHQKLRSAVKLHDGHVQELKKTIACHAQNVIDSEKEVSELKARQVESLSTIRSAVVQLHDAQSVLLPEMIKALPFSDRAVVKEQLPILFPSGGEELMGQENTEIFSSVVPSLTKDSLRP
jgi:predicted  nucleic acid-binding Zn-ribbon protein